MQAATMESLCKKISSGGTPSRKHPEFYADYNDGHLWVKSKELLDGPIHDTEENISDEGLKRSSAKYFPINTVLIAMYGANVGQLGWLKQPATVNQAICGMVINEKVADPRYVFYALLHTRPRLAAKAQGAAQQNLNQALIRNFEIPAPSLRVQKLISAVLSAYDDLIENNTRRIAILEAMAQALYREWFVHFRFPQVPSTSEVPGTWDAGNGRLPMGWEQKRIKDVCERITSGGTPRTKEPTYWNGDIPWLSSGETRNRIIIETEKTITPLGVEKSSTKLAKSGSIVIASAGQGHTRGQTSLLMIDTYINQSVLNLSANVVSNHYLFFNLSNRYEEMRMASDSFSSRGSLTTKLIGSLDIIVPSSDLLAKFDRTVEPIVQLIVNLQHKNANLRQTRDLLLPRLISGELDVSQLDIASLK